MKKLSGLWLILILTVCASSARGWGRQSDAGTSAAAWLIQPSSARLLAMGGAGTAFEPGVAGWWWNTASPAGIEGINAEASIQRHFADTEMSFFTLAYPTPWGVPCLGLTHVETGEIVGYDADGRETESFSIASWAAKFGWSMSLDRLSLGLAATFLKEDWHVAQSSGVGLDAGILYQWSPDLRLGLSVLRLGSTKEQLPLPAEARLGGSARLFEGLQVVLDIASPRDGEAYLASGVEWTPLAPLAFRLGWRTGPADNWQLGTLAFFSAGLGVNWSGFTLDYAYEPAGVLGDSHHLSLGYRFGAVPASDVTPAAITRTAEAELTPKLQILPRSYEGRMVFTPKEVKRNYQVKSINFKVKDAEGKIIRTFTFAGQSLPKELVWDGKDSRGRTVNQDKTYNFAFEYVTDQGVQTEEVAWPQVLPARKLYFRQGGVGVEAGVLFGFSGACERVKSWRLTVLDRTGRQPVRGFTGQGGLPGSVEWDGKDEAGGWAPANHKYMYRLELIGMDYSQVAIEHSIVPVPAEIISCDSGRVKFKILEILFDFARSAIRAEMADKIEKAAELHRRQSVVIRAVQGHADEIGTPSANRIISRKRARAVANFIAKENIRGFEEVAVEGFGKDRPLASGAGETRRSRNRRVEILLEAPEPELNVPPRERK